MATTYEHIASVTVTSSASSISFTSIPATYTDLVLIGVVTGSLDETLYVDWGFNNDTGNNYGRWVWGQAGGSATNDNRNGNRARIEWDVLEVQDNISYSFIAHVNDYASTAIYKNIFGISINAGIDGTQGINYAGGMWANTAAVTRIDMLPNNPAKSWGAGTTLAMFGIKAA
jgi:hypothetical protein